MIVIRFIMPLLALFSHIFDRRASASFLMLIQPPPRGLQVDCRENANIQVCKICDTASILNLVTFKFAVSSDIDIDLSCVC